MDRHDGPGSLEKESVRLRKAPGRGLPPLQDTEGNGRLPSRGHSAPTPDAGFGDISEEAESAVRGALNKARSLENKNKKFSSTEKNLFNSPFAQPVLKAIADGKATSPH